MHDTTTTHPDTHQTVDDLEQEAAVAFSESLVEDPGPTSRIDELKRQLASEYEDLIEAAEARLQLLDRDIADLTERRKQTADDLRTHRREIERLTGERPDKPPADSGTDGKFECPHAGCDRTFATKHGVTMHKARSHRNASPGPKPEQRPMPSTSTKSVYRCGQLGDDFDDGVCGHEVKSLADLSHHTLTAHRRQPNPAEKILVTPDN